MKPTLLLILLMALLCSSTQLLANTVIVKGYVKTNSGNPIANAEVKITVFGTTTAAACGEFVIKTNNTGFYSKEVTCPADIKRLRIAVKNCDNTMLTLEKEVPASKLVEANFIVCKSNTANCSAKFSYMPKPASTNLSSYTFLFNSALSEVLPGDKIEHTVWNFNDGTPVVNNRFDLLHTFAKAGIYEVCLTIKTVKGCESKVCQKVVINVPEPVKCLAGFKFERLAPNKFRFASSPSMVAANDEVILRKWDFKDGTTSNEASPLHEFAKPGLYEVCLYIKTAKGCESKFCTEVKVVEQSSTENVRVKITALYPMPVKEMLKAEIFSKEDKIDATIAIVNVYGIIQSVKKVTLTKGFNQYQFNVNNLPAGLYYFKVTTKFGTLNKPFHKI